MMKYWILSESIKDSAWSLQCSRKSRRAGGKAIKASAGRDYLTIFAQALRADILGSRLDCITSSARCNLPQFSNSFALEAPSDKGLVYSANKRDVVGIIDVDVAKPFDRLYVVE